MTLFKRPDATRGHAMANDRREIACPEASPSRELTTDEIRTMGGGVVESPPPTHDMLVRPGDTKGVAL